MPSVFELRDALDAELLDTAKCRQQFLILFGEYGTEAVRVMSDEFHFDFFQISVVDGKFCFVEELMRGACSSTWAKT